MTTRQDLLRLFVTLVAIAGFFIGLAGCISYARLGQVVGQAVSISPYFALAIILCSVLLYAARTDPKRARWWALGAIVTISCVAMAARWSHVWINGRSISETVAIGMIVAGAVAALFLRGRILSPGFLIPRTDFIVALLTIPTSIFVAFFLIEDNIVTRQKLAHTSAKAVALDVWDRTARAQTVIRRLSDRWSVMSDLPAPALIEHEFKALLNDFPFFLGLALADEAGNISWEHHRYQVLDGETQGLMATDGLQSTLQRAQRSGQTEIAILQEDVWGRKAGLIVAPISSTNTMSSWSVIATIDMAEIVSWAMRRTDYNAYFSVSHDSSVLYQSMHDMPRQAIAAGSIDIPLSEGTGLQFFYVYTPSSTGLDTEVWAESIWLGGLAFAFFLIASLRLTRIAKRHAVQLEHNALHDPLTGLPNRRMLEQTLTKACANTENDMQPVSVVFFDVDGIKLINDSVSHAAGDVVLREIAWRLQRGAQSGATVTQIGGVDFVVLFLGLSRAQVEQRTQQLIADLSRPYRVADRMVSVTVNAGIAIGDETTTDPMELVRRADLAMLRSKREGRNSWAAYTDDLSTEIAERVELREALQNAIENDGLELHYQPIIEGSKGQVAGVEALLRWSHPTHGAIPPARFVQLAEETGQILSLTDWVLNKACHHSAQLRKRGFSSFPVIVNISPLYFLGADFVEKMEQLLRDTGLAPEFLELEITENVFLGSEDHVIQKLIQLGGMGIKTSIDDFGTGYSSLSYLKTLPIDKVKIDGSFISDVVSNSANAAIVQGIISMGHHLDLKVVAEWVETGAQFDFLMRNNCDLFQGYLFAQPMPFDDLVAELTRKQCQLLPPGQ